MAAKRKLTARDSPESPKDAGDQEEFYLDDSRAQQLSVDDDSDSNEGTSDVDDDEAEEDDDYAGSADSSESSSNESEAEEEESDGDDEEAPHVSNVADSGPHPTVLQSASDPDTSDEEDARNTVGNIPMEWYKDYLHLGYDLSGKQIFKPASGDELDAFLAKMDDPNYWRSVKDKFSGREIVLTDEQLDMIEKIQKSEYVTSSDPYEPYVDYFTQETMVHPLTNKPTPKRSFVPSKWENQKIMRIIKAIRLGWIKPHPGTHKPRVYMLWDEVDQPEKRKHQMHIPAPKMKLPGHEESYNPPPEYLPTEEEVRKWKEADPEDRERDFLPQKFNSLREVPAYPRFIRERFERCLDLYLCPRQLKMRVNIDDPSVLLPKLPKPKDLQPFPVSEAIVYRGHSAMVRCIAVEPQGQWLASGSDDGTVRLWEVESGYCCKTILFGGTPHSIAFNPSLEMSLLTVAIDSKVYLLNHGLGDRLVAVATDTALTTAASSNEDPSVAGGSTVVVQWAEEGEAEKRDLGLRVCLTHPKTVKQVTWHHKGDYLATVMPEGGNSAVQIHQLSKWRTQNPFQKSKGLIQKVAFHPSKPLFFVATQRYVRVYDLSKLQLLKKLLTGVKWISSIDIHPQGDNLIIGSYDKRLTWFDMDLSSKPYKVLRHHSQAVRQVCYHRKHPLFASCSDDGSAIVCHGMVYSDLLQNPLIVPVKVLRGHQVVNKIGVLDCQFHPTQPWLFTAGADSTIRLFT